MASVLTVVREKVLRETAGHVAKLVPQAYAVVAQALADGDTKIAMQLLTASGALRSGGRALGMDDGTGGASGEHGRVQITVNLDQTGAKAGPSPVDHVVKPDDSEA